MLFQVFCSDYRCNNDELQVLGRRQADGSPIVKVEQLRDGVVLFEDLADAEQYSTYLEANQNKQV